MEYATRHLYFSFTHEPVGECVYMKKIQVTSGMFHGIPRESIA